MEYSHTQRGFLSLILLLSAGGVLAMLLVPDLDRIAVTVVLVVAVVLDLCAISFHSMTVQDGGHELVIRFGPVPLFSKRIEYAKIKSVEPGRTNFLDGWGIHYMPGRGWTYNLWGFDCVKLDVDGRTVRVGTDDVDGLVAFLKRKIG